MEHTLVGSHQYFDTEKCKKLSLDELSLPDLRILLEKQTKLLSCSQILSQLPDRGDKIKQYISGIEKVMAVKENYDAAIRAMSDLKIEETPSLPTAPAAAPTSSPPASPSIKSATLPANNIDEDKLGKLKSRIASRPVPRGTQLLTGAEEEQVSDRNRVRQREARARESEIRLGDFMGMFKVGNVKVGSELEEAGRIDVQDIRLRDQLGEDSDSDSEVSDQSKNSSGEGPGGAGEGVNLNEECLIGSTQYPISDSELV